MMEGKERKGMKVRREEGRTEGTTEGRRGKEKKEGRKEMNSLCVDENWERILFQGRKEAKESEEEGSKEKRKRVVEGG